MNLNEFKELMNDSEKRDIALLHWEEIFDVSINCCKREIKYIAIMEELAELQQAISKLARAELEDADVLIEEMADVTICIEMLRRMTGISSYNLSKAVNAKIYREGVRRGVIREDKEVEEK